MGWRLRVGDDGLLICWTLGIRIRAVNREVPISAVTPVDSEIFINRFFSHQFTYTSSKPVWSKAHITYTFQQGDDFHVDDTIHEL